jgi:hypothetical protein
MTVKVRDALSRCCVCGMVINAPLATSRDASPAVSTWAAIIMLICTLSYPVLGFITCSDEKGRTR